MKYIDTKPEKNGDELIVKMNTDIISLFDTFRIKLFQSGYAECYTTWGRNEVLRTPATLYYIVEGTAVIYISGNKVTMVPNHLYFIPPMVEFRGSCTFMKQLYFHLNIYRSDIKDETDLFTGCRRVISFPVDNINEYISCYSGTNYSDFVRLYSLLTYDISRILTEYDFNVNSNLTYKDSTTKALLYIKENLSGSLKISDISKDLYISKNKLTTDFFNDTGVKLSKFIQIQLLTETQKLLTESNLTTSEISDRLNFCSRSHFSAFFKKRCGLSQGKFRNFYQDSIRKKQ